MLLLRPCFEKQNSRAWWRLLKSQHSRERQKDFCEFEASLGYISSPRTARTKYRDPDSAPPPNNNRTPKQNWGDSAAHKMP